MPDTASYAETRGSEPASRHHRNSSRRDRWTADGWSTSRAQTPSTQPTQPLEPPPRPGRALADTFFLTAHDPATGAPLLHLNRIGAGLAGALLGELVQARRITVDSGRLAVLDPTPPPDAVDHLVLEHLLCEPAVKDVSIWLEFLSVQSRELVGDRLHRTGQVERRKSRRHTVFVPLDYGKAAWLATRIQQQLSQFGRLTPTDTTLAGLMAATGLHTKVLTGTGRDVFAHLGALVESLPQPLYELVCQVRTQVDKAVR